MTMHRFIVISGLDGSGKDTIAAKLAELDPNSELVSTPTFPFTECRKHLDDIVLETPTAHYFFYLAAIVHASIQIEKILIKKNVYCVRWLVDTIANHRTIGVDCELEYKTKLYDIKEPDLSLFLSCEDRVRQERIKARDHSTIADEITFREGVCALLQKEYAKLRDHFISIDNSDKSVEQTVVKIRKVLETIN